MTRDILYLDDDQQGRELGRKFLEREGYNVNTHESPEEGINCYQGEPVVITDYIFEGEATGMDVAQALEDDAQVIIHTGYQQDFVERNAGTEIPEDTIFVLKGGGYQEVLEEVNQAIKD